MKMSSYKMLLFVLHRTVEHSFLCFGRAGGEGTDSSIATGDHKFYIEGRDVVIIE
jgi:hypothetical protein